MGAATESGAAYGSPIPRLRSIPTEVQHAAEMFDARFFCAGLASTAAA